MRLIVGLGNPGEKYEQTRHNVGFMVLDSIIEEEKIVFREESPYESKFAEMGEWDERIKLVKPETFMNESGRAIEKIKQYWKVDDEDIWVIHDDVDLEFGTVRVQLGGSSAGHKGIQSIIDHIGDKFWRIRIGIGKNEQVPTDIWVLQRFDDPKKAKQIIDKAGNLVLDYLHKEIREETINIL